MCGSAFCFLDRKNLETGGASRIKFWWFHVTRPTLQKPEGGAPFALFVIVVGGS
jgi:hypothetical protein